MVSQNGNSLPAHSNRRKEICSRGEASTLGLRIFTRACTQEGEEVARQKRCERSGWGSVEQVAADAEHLEDVAGGDDADQAALANDRQLAGTSLAHLAEGVHSRVVRRDH